METLANDRLVAPREDDLDRPLTPADWTDQELDEMERYLTVGGELDEALALKSEQTRWSGC